MLKNNSNHFFSLSINNNYPNEENYTVINSNELNWVKVNFEKAKEIEIIKSNLFEYIPSDGYFYLKGNPNNFAFVKISLSVSAGCSENNLYIKWGIIELYNKYNSNEENEFSITSFSNQRFINTNNNNPTGDISGSGFGIVKFKYNTLYTLKIKLLDKDFNNLNNKIIPENLKIYIELI